MGAPWGRSWSISLFAIVLAGFGLRLFLFSGMTCYDEFHYAHIASNMASGNFDPAAASGFFGFRYALLLPVAALFSLFGISAWTAACWPMLCSLGTIAVIAWIGRLLFGPAAGAIAALIYAAFPMSAVYASILYPEEVLCFFCALSVLLFLKGERSGGKRAAVLFLMSGAACGAAYYSRLNGLLLLLFYGAYGLFWGWKKERLLVLLGLGFALMPEALLNLSRSGDILFSLKAQQAKLAIDARAFSTGLLVYPRAMLGADAYGQALFGVLYQALFLAIAIFAAGRRPAGAGIPLLWFACTFLYLQFGPSGFGQGYQPLHKQLRLLSMTAAPASLFLGSFLARMARPWLGASLAVLLGAGIFGGAKMAEYYSVQAAPYRTAFAYLKGVYPASVRVPDEDWRARLNFYYRTPLSHPYYPSLGAVPGGVTAGPLSPDPGRAEEAAWISFGRGTCAGRNEVYLGGGANLCLKKSI